MLTNLFRWPIIWQRKRLFIVDEASMISDEISGNNRETLLQDLSELRLQHQQLQTNAGWRYRPVTTRRLGI
jgi:hypothetical protein